MMEEMLEEYGILIDISRKDKELKDESKEEKENGGKEEELKDEKEEDEQEKEEIHFSEFFAVQTHLFHSRNSHAGNDKSQERCLVSITFVDDMDDPHNNNLTQTTTTLLPDAVGKLCQESNFFKDLIKGIGYRNERENATYKNFRHPKNVEELTIVEANPKAALDFLIEIVRGSADKLSAWDKEWVTWIFSLYMTDFLSLTFSLSDFLSL